MEELIFLSEEDAVVSQTSTNYATFHKIKCNKKITSRHNFATVSLLGQVKRYGVNFAETLPLPRNLRHLAL